MIANTTNTQRVKGKPDLKERIGHAIRSAAYHCDVDCGLEERECDDQHPIQVAAWRWNKVASVYGEIDALAAVVVPVINEEVAAIRLGNSVLDESVTELRECLEASAAEKARLRAEVTRLRTYIANGRFSPSEDIEEPELTPEQREYNIASGELFQLGAYGHFGHWPDGVIHPTAYLDVLRAAQERFAAAVRNSALAEGAELIHRHRGDLDEALPWWDTRDKNTATGILDAARTPIR